MAASPPPVRALVFDLGAGSGRAIVATLARGRLTLEPVHRFTGYETRFDDGPGWAIETIRAGLRDGLVRAAAAGPIDSVAVDGWGVDFALLDETGALVDEPRSYRHPRGARGMAALSERLEAIGTRTGVQVLPIATVFHLSDFARQHPEALARTRHVVMIADLLAHDLSGAIACERTLARTSGLLAVDGQWARDVIDWAGLPQHLFGRLVDAGTVLGPLRPSLAGNAALTGTKVVAGAGHDTACAAFALAPAADEAFMVAGSWTLLGADVPDGHLPTGLQRHGFGLEGGIGGRALVTRSLPGLFLVRRLRACWRAETGEDVSFAEIGARALAADAATPAIDATDAAFFDPVDVIAAIRTHRPALSGADLGALARALYRGLAQAVADGLARLGDLAGRRVRALRVGGGGCQDAAFQEILAAETDCTILAGPVEASAVGNALIQFVALGALPSFEAARAFARRGAGTEPAP